MSTSAPFVTRGITPVFESLLKAGIILPMSNQGAIVQTPIFPVKKKRAPGKPDDCRFVQDLQTVNTAVHASHLMCPIHTQSYHRFQLTANTFHVLTFRTLCFRFHSTTIHNFGLLFLSMVRCTRGPIYVRALPVA